MIDWSKSLSAYGRAWNERDRAERIGLLAGALVDDCRYTDTEFDATGPQGVADVIGAYHERFPGFVIRLTSAVDGHHDVIRFTWAYEAMQDGERIEIDGADTILLAHDGQLRQIIVFDGATLPSTEPGASLTGRVADSRIGGK